MAQYRSIGNLPSRRDAWLLSDRAADGDFINPGGKTSLALLRLMGKTRGVSDEEHVSPTVTSTHRKILVAHMLVPARVPTSCYTANLWR